MTDDERHGLETDTNADTTRRRLLRAATGGFALAICELFLPEGTEETRARGGVLDGTIGGRRGKDHKGRHRHRIHGDRKDKDKHGDGAPRGSGPFRSSALTVVNIDARPLPPITLHCTFYYRIKTGLDTYGPPVASIERTLATGESFRYAPDRFRVGVLIRHVILSEDIYADVRNLPFWLPTGSVSGGQNLDPAAGKTGSIRIREQGYDFGETHVLVVPRLSLKRKSDSDTHIEWELTVTQI
ncbi:MAG: hypothetical protein U0031_12235 [Thermomicrobiales bacterium]